MRNVVSVSLPSDALGYLNKRTSETGLSTSAYMLRLLKHDEKLISEEELLEMCKQAEEEYRKGNCITLRTDDDIDAFFKKLYKTKKK